MSTTALRIHQLTPLLFRDGRPFGDAAEETRAIGLVVPPPTTVAGFVRTLLGTARGWDWAEPDIIARAQAIPVTRMIFERTVTTADGQRSEFVVPAPLDAVPYSDDAKRLHTMVLRPSAYADGEGSDLPASLQPVAVTSDVKPESGYSWWAWSDFEQVLLDASVVPAKVTPPAVEERTQIAIDSQRRAASEGALFVVEYRGWELHHRAPGATPTTELWRLIVEVADDGAQPPATLLGHFGGERRPAVAERLDDAGLPSPSAALQEVLCGSTRVALRLLTPAIFTDGWRPGWLGQRGGSGPWRSLVDAGARLVSAVASRPQPISGWSYDQRRRGPKAGRRAVPAGSTYFLQLQRPLQADEIEELWMINLSDEERDRRDGFGCSVVGVWS